MVGNYYPLGQVGSDCVFLEHVFELYPWVVHRSGIIKILSIY